MPSSAGVLDRTKESAQMEFITLLGPYLRLAKIDGQEQIFFDRVYTLWFVHWPLKPHDFEDEDTMRDYKNSTKKVGTS